MKTKQKTILAAAAVAVSAVLAACSFIKPKDHGELEPYQGLFYDVNSKSVLEIRGKYMTLTWGSWKETVKIRLNHTEYGDQLVPENGDPDFGFMTVIDILPDGSLSAVEPLLDAPGHTYSFVREEVLEKEREIRDLSEDLPKEIHSEELTDFHLYFTLGSVRYDFGDSGPLSGSYSFDLTREEEGRYLLQAEGMGDSYVILRFEKEVPEEFVKELRELIVSEGLPALNGYYQKNNVRFPGYSLEAEYSSGEILRIRADGEAAKSCVFRLKPFTDLLLSAGDQETGME